MKILIKSKLVKEFIEKITAHGFKLNSSLDLVSLELDACIESSFENEILATASDITDIPTNVHFHKSFFISTPVFLSLKSVNSERI